MATESLKTKAVSSTFWKFAERIVAKAAALIVTLIVANILEPEDYSVVSIITIFFSFANLIITGGFSTALVQKKDADIVDYSSVLFLSILLAFTSYVVLFICAPHIAQGYHRPQLLPMIRLMGIILPVSAIQSVVCAYISSRLEFKKFFFATLFGTLISATVGISMASYGAGAWSIIAQEMTNTFVDTLVLLMTSKIRFVPVISRDRIRKLFSYGWKVFLSSLIGLVIGEITPLVIGFKYNDDDLAYYTKGRSFPGTLSTATTETMAATLFPVLVEHQDDSDQLRQYTRLYIRITSYVAFPLMLGLAAVADNFVYAILSEKWIGIVPYLRLFCVVLMFDMINIGNCETIKAMGRSDVFLIMEIIKKTSYLMTTIIFLKYTDSPLELAFASLINTVIAITVNSIPNIKLIDYKLSMQLYDIVPNLLASAAMCSFVLVIGRTLSNSFITLFVQVVTGAVFYTMVSVFFRNPSFFYLLDLVKEKLPIRRKK